MARLPRTPVDAVVDGFTHGGDGVVRIDGKAVFVPGALPGEHVRVQVVQDRRRWARARLVEVVEAAADRTIPPCPHARDCGGCDLQHVTPAGQLRLKTRVLREQLQRIGGIADPPVADCISVGPSLGYRSTARLHADDQGHLGFRRAGSHEVVPIDVCPVLDDATQAVRAAVGDSTGAAQVQVRATNVGDRAAVLEAGDEALVIDEVPDDVQIAVARTSRDVDESVGTASGGGSGPAMVRGSGIVTQRVGDHDLDVAVGGFFQVSVAGAQALVREVLHACRGGPGGSTGDGPSLAGHDVWDLYSGVGLFAVPLAVAGARVCAVEVDARATELCRGNAARAGVADRVAATAMDVRDFVQHEVAASPDHVARPDLVVLDPPRVGAGKEVMTALHALAPTLVVYVACDPAALARDARTLVELGWHMADVQPLDLFPMTHHVEAVATFRRP